MDEQLFGHSPFPILIYNVDSLRIQTANDAFLKRYNFTKKDLSSGIGKVNDLHLPAERSRASRWYKQSEPVKGVNGARWKHQAKPKSYHVKLFMQEYENSLRLLYIVDITADVEADKAIQNRSIFFDKLFKDAPQGMVLIDSNNAVQKVNRSFENLFGFNLAELKGQDLDDMITRHSEGPDEKLLPKNLQDGPVYTQVRRFTKNGRALDVVVGGIPVYIEGELVGGIGTYIDITGQQTAQRKLKQSLDEKQVLLEEVHHRVKNNLAVVSGLLQMQTMHVEDPRLTRYIQNSQLRIRSMAIVHEMLYKSQSLSALDMCDYVKELADVISSTLSPPRKQINTKVKSDEITLNVNQAIPCALIISELITNAYEYAFEGRNRGEVTIALSKRENRITVSVQDDGIGLPDDFEAMRKKSLGLSLVENLCIQLETEIEINSDDPGTCFRFTFQKEESINDEVFA